MEPIWKDGIMFMLRLGNEILMKRYTSKGEKEVALSLLITALIAQGREYQ